MPDRVLALLGRPKLHQRVDVQIGSVDGLMNIAMATFRFSGSDICEQCSGAEKLEARKLPENTQTPISRVHAVLVR